MNFPREKSVLAVMGYKSGASAPMKSVRQQKLRAIYNARLESELSEEEYRDTGAASWGDPKSEQRLHAIVRCLLSPIELWELYDPRDRQDAVRHREEDAGYLAETYLGPSCCR